ncbi:MAG: GtrA family protein [Anaerolineaceae bacterium]|nr:GtrA family protein [Anaerolineaceae bacterium]
MSAKIPYHLDPKETRRFLRFMIVGAGGTIIDFSILSLLKLLGLPTLPANTISYLTGVINNFYWNRRWTFSETRAQRWDKQFVQFLVVSLVGLLLNDGLVVLLETPFNVWFGRWGYIPAKVIATGVVVFWNYIGNRLWTFRTSPPRS